MQSKIYRAHRCDKSHRTFKTAAKCIWPWSNYRIMGDGPYAITEKFRVGGKYTAWDVTLYQTLDDWNKAWMKEQEVHADGYECCGSCIRQLDRVILAPTVMQKDNKIDWT